MAHQAAEPEPSRGPAVLVVEDEEQIRRVARRVLEKNGYKVLTAGDGLEALQLFRENEGEIVLVLTDALMPRMDGRALYEALREAGNQVPVLFMSGHSERESEATAGLDPKPPFLAKPWTLDELLAKVREATNPRTP